MSVKNMSLATSLFAIMFVPSVRADVAPHGLFSDNMVLQRGTKVAVWGKADDGEKVTVSIQGQEASATAQDGIWMVHLNDLKAGGPFQLRISGNNTITFRNVMVGEVWICSGQSNMQWSILQSEHPRKTVRNSTNEMLRLFTVDRETAPEPRDEVKGSGWTVCSPHSSPNFSAVAYHFGRELQKALNVPVGLISTNLGGTKAEWWTRKSAISGNPVFESVFEDDFQSLERYAQIQERYIQQLDRHRVAALKAQKEGKRLPPVPRRPFAWNIRPGGLYNAMIAPLLNFSFKGAIWYQGESNASRAHVYRTLFPAMIKNWRDDFKQGEFPFLFVQLAPFMKIVDEPQESAWAELREAQLFTALSVPNTGMAVITDAGNPDDIHPKKKQPAGERLALAALGIAYNARDVVYSGPVFSEMSVTGNKAMLRFKHTGRGLTAKDGPLTGFTIAGEDKKFVNAEAMIEGDTVIVSSPSVEKPIAVRYGWADCPVVNLYNAEGLPASPFRTDNFPGVTGP